MGTDLEVVEERFPDGRKGEPLGPQVAEVALEIPGPVFGDASFISSLREASASSRSASAVAAMEPPPLRPRSGRKLRKLLGKLNEHWPSAQAFTKRQVKPRIPWFPVGWLDDLVQQGWLSQKDEAGKTWYGITLDGLEVIGALPEPVGTCTQGGGQRCSH